MGEFSYTRNHVVNVGQRINSVRASLKPQWELPEVSQENILRGMQGDFTDRDLPSPEYDGVALQLQEFTFNRLYGHLGLTVSYGRYSQYRFTMLDPEFRKSYPDPQFWFSVLVLGAIVVTGDNKVRLHWRSSKSLQSANRLDTPCGHPSNMRLVPEVNLLGEAFQTVIIKELGKEPAILSVSPLLVMIEDTILNVDLIYILKVRETSSELHAYGGEEKIEFVDYTPGALRHVRNEIPLSRSLPEALEFAIDELEAGRG